MSTNQAKIEWDDTILPFQLDKSDVRGRVARLDGLLNTILEQHNYPLEVSAILAEAVVLTALIGPTVKLRWKLSLQIRGDGPIRILATDYYGPQNEGEPARIRAYASFNKERLETERGTPFEKIGKGIFGVLIDQGQDMKPYQGMTPLAGGSLAACASTYFAQSEQLPTEFELSVGQSSTAEEQNEWRAGGVMVQLMPQASPFATKDPEGDAPEIMQSDNLDLGEYDDGWNRATMHLKTVEETELVGPYVSPTTLLMRLFHEDQPRVFDTQPAEFGCSCGPEKVEFTMSMYSQKDIEKMTADNGMVTADCQFCGAHYELDPKTLGFDAKS
ncbi:Hsp33 family molecular chaperone HslO [Amylibacter sp. SFDW26]|uniref:Hsp33 family molecular chaperone HslO n=1 Tax=Amylibacter sp. SFDW26 TaxID=2652722 RepID=UPI001262A212|nr:Hsp33 family molecular chaperone HslO [Amylibacter sp. SFDW26]KAB7614671.1 Hsp33 family molecular chaperone HslO [Amylibacter sp. SFDW26]